MVNLARSRLASLKPGPSAVALALAAFAVAPASRADWKFTPYAGVTETYTDNVLLRPGDQARSQFVSELTPGFSLSNQSSRVQFAADYSKTVRHYSDEDLTGTQGSQQQLRSTLRARLYEETLLLDAVAGISQQANSAFGPQPVTGPNGSVGFVDGLSNEVKTLRIAPSLHHRFGSTARIDVTYSHDRVLSDNAALGDYSADNVIAVLSSGPAFNQLGWSLSYQDNRQDNKSLVRANITPSANSKNYSAGLQYQLQPGLTLLLNAGYDHYDYEALPGDSNPSGKSWSAGVSWIPNSRTSVQATAGRRYFGDSYSLQANHRSRASVFALSYSDAVTTTQAQFFQPGTISTLGFLDQLFAGTIQDPVVRRSVVEAYIQANNLPSSLSTSTNYFSNRFMLQKQLQASGAWVGSRGTLLVNLTDSRREALSTQRADNDLLGSINNQLNDDIRQTGASASFSWRLSSRTGANIGASRSRSRSLTVNRTDNNNSVRAGVSHEFARKVNGSVEVRRTRGATVAADSKYTENAVSASLNKRF